MLRNFWKIALRQLGKQKFYSAIKIGGFALGIATCLLMALYIHTQLSFDRDFPNSPVMYRLAGAYDNRGKIEKGATWPAPMARAVKSDYPEVVRTARLMSGTLFDGAGNNQFRPIDNSQDIYEEGFAYADSSLLDMFGVRMIYGSAVHALGEPRSLVLSKRKADKYWPGQDPTGKLVYLNDDKDHPWKVGGVMSDPPTNSSLQYDFYLSLSGHELWKGEQDLWLASNYEIYLQLRPDADATKLGAALSGLINKYWYPPMKQAGIADAGDMSKKLSFWLQPVSNMHLKTEWRDSFSHVEEKWVWAFGAIAFAILLLATINFVNLSTARSAGRAREVGLRKVVGSGKAGLIRQFLLESVVTCLFAFVLAVVAAWLLLPLFNTLAGTSMRFPWTAWWLAPGVLAASVLIGCIAGIYPAFYLSAFSPVQVLKGSVARGARHSGLRSGLVVFQFTTAVVLIVATLVVYGQMHFILNAKLGFNKDQVMLIQGTGTLGKQLPAFKEELSKLSGVQSVTISDFLPISGGKRNMNTFYKKGREKLDPGTAAQIWNADESYLNVMGIKMTEGRNFQPGMRSDSQSAIINRAMAKQLGLTHPIGQHISRGTWDDLPIIGVIEDFNFESVKEEIGPLALVMGNWATIVAVRSNTTDIKGLLMGVNKVWKDFSPQSTLRYNFLDESFRRMYEDVQQTGNIFTSLAVLAVSIACLGLLALSAYMAEQRRKEMGIRKVLGASIWQVTSLLSRDFMRLVGLAVLIGVPLAWWGMHSWLQNYVYRMNMGAGIFIGAAALVGAIALLTISMQVLKTGRANPVAALRSE